jgi:hypothetical protein
MIEPARYMGDIGDEGIEPQAFCIPCLACKVCSACGLCSYCGCIATPLSDVYQQSVINTLTVTSW